MDLDNAKQHVEGIVALLGALWTLISVINGFLHKPEVMSAWGKLLDAFSYISRKNAAGSVKLPLTASKTPEAPALELPKDGAQ